MELVGNVAWATSPVFIFFGVLLQLQTVMVDLSFLISWKQITNDADDFRMRLF